MTTTEKASHTPGPWSVEDAEGMSTPHPYETQGDAAIVSKGHGVAVVCAYLRNQEEQYANARLMAAGPEMLEALESILEIARGLLRGECYDLSGPKFIASFRRAEDAIRKAKQGA